MISTKVFANTLARVRSGRLDGERLRRIVEAPSVADALKMLADYGYSYAQDGSIDAFITAETNELIAFVEEQAATDGVRNALLAPFRYLNAKLAYKSRFVDIPSDAYCAAETDIQAIASGDYESCDRHLAAALEKLDAAEESRPQVIDVELTRAMYRYILSCPAGVVKKYFRSEIDVINILTAARMRRLGISRDEFIDGGRYVKIAALEESVGADSFAECFECTPYAEMAERLEHSEFRSVGEYTRDSDDFLLALTRPLCEDMGSDTPFLNYYAETRIELKTLKTALVCVKTDSRDAFYPRRPELYA